MDWLDNPRTHIEKRIKQLHGRIDQINLANGKRADKSWQQKYFQANILRNKVFREITSLRNKLREFDKCPLTDKNIKDII